MVSKQMNGECPKCKKFTQLRFPTFGEAGLRGLTALISNPRSIPDVIFENKPHGTLWKCTSCSALSGECPQCEILSLGGANMRCRSCGLEYFAGGQS